MGNGPDHAEAFRAFYRAHYGLLLTVAEHRLDSRQEAEDATADAFQVAWRRHADDAAALTLPWLYQILRNVIGTEYRRRARSRRADERIREDVATETPDDRAIETRLALRRLSEDDREVLYMAYWEDLTSDEMAGILGTTPGAVRVRLTRARERLRRILVPPAVHEGEGHG